MEQHRRFPALRSELDQARQFIAQMAAQANLDSTAIQRCELAVDEAMSNIIEHGYRVQSRANFIDVNCNAAPHQLAIVLLDDGPAFDPLAYPAPNPDTPLADRHGGGWGVHLIRTLMDEVHYARVGQRNRLTLIKHPTQP
jgi:serine/threonine-protein kinase RsbW